MISFLALMTAAACVDLQSDRITASDVARAVPAFTQLPPSQVISYSPVPGVSRTFTALELQAALRKQSVTSEVADSVCFEWPMRNLSAEEVRSAMLASLPQGSDVVLQGRIERTVPRGAVTFPLSGIGNGPASERDWNGFVEYAPGRKYPVSARVVLQVPFTRVVTTSPIRAGERLTADRLRLETGTGAPSRVEMIADVPQAEGKTMSRFVPAGTPLSPSMLHEPTAVSRGDALQVEVLSGNARLRFDALAESSAETGALVPVRMRETGRIIHGRVIAPGRVLLDLSAEKR